MPIRMDLEVKGLRQLQQQLKGNDLYAEPWKNLLGAVGQRGENLAASNAPRGRTGALEAKIKHRVQQKPFPQWVAIRSYARRKTKKYPRGFLYPRLLNFSQKHGHLGWFTSPLRRLQTVAGPLLQQAAREIEANFAFKTKG